MSDDLENSEYRRRLGALVQREQASRGVGRDRWNQPPVRSGRLRGQVANVRGSETACEFGTLLIMDFDIVADPPRPGVPVRMSGISFSGQLIEGTVVDVPDPDPAQRPIITTRLFIPHGHEEWTFEAYYPGRDEPSQRALTLHGLLAVGGPVLALLAALAALHFWAHVF